MWDTNILQKNFNEDTYCASLAQFAKKEVTVRQPG